MPRSTGRTWTPATTARLFDMTREGLSQKEIAQKLRRSPKAVERKVAKVRRALVNLPFPRLVHMISTYETAAFLAR